MLLFISRPWHFNFRVPAVTMHPSVVNVTDCFLFFCPFKQSRAAVQLREDMKKIVGVPLSEQQDPAYKKLFGVSLQELQQQGLTKDGVPTMVRSIVEYLVQRGESQLLVL